VLVGHCYEAGSFTLPYQPFVEAFDAYASQSDADSLRQELGTGAPDLARLVHSLRELLHVEPSAAGDPLDDRWRLFTSVLAFIRRAGAGRPILLVIEDLHDADRGTLDLLVYLAHNLAGTPLLVVCTYRDVDVDRTHPLSGTLGELRRVGRVGRLHLVGLPADDIQRLLASASRQPIRRPVAELVHRRTDGNPLFAHEILRFLLAERIEWPVAAGRGGAAADDTLLGHIPEGLRDIVGKRLSRLTDSANQLLSAASVIGREFQLEVLRRVLARPDEQIEAALEKATAASIVEERFVVGAAVTYRFAHAFFRQTLYEEILAPRRIRLHQSIARAIEDVYASTLDEHASELAEHYAFSSDAADLTRAVGYGGLAARRACEVFAYGEAAYQLERALRIQDLFDPEDSSTRCDLLLALGETLALAGDTQRAIAFAAPGALALAENLGDRHRAFQACRIALDSLDFQGSSLAAARPEFLLWAERAGRFAEPGGSERAQANLWLALVLALRDHLTEARALRFEALAIARRSADPQTLFLAASYLLSSPGSTAARLQAERKRLAQEATSWPRDRVSGPTLARVLWHAGRVALSEGDRSGAVELWQQLEELTRRTNMGLFVLERDAMLACLDGHLEEALVLLEQLGLMSDSVGASLRGLAHTFVTQLELTLLLGRPADGLSKLDGYIARWPPAGDNAFTPPALVVGRALALVALGRLAQARSLAGPLLDRLPGMDFEDSWGEIIHLVLGLQCAIALEHRPAARALTAQLECVAHVSIEPWAMTSVPRQLAAASVLTGDLAAAHSYGERALETASKIGFRPDIALTHLQLAEILLNEGKRGQAQQHLDIAIPELNEMQMQPARMRALHLVALAERGELPDTPSESTLEGLTRREGDVARLIASGRTNHEIGEALVITEGTVEVHVKHILGKLGFKSRSQVATWVIENRLQTPNGLPGPQR